MQKTADARFAPALLSQAKVQPIYRGGIDKFSQLFRESQHVSVAYFYAVVEEDFAPSNVAEKIRKTLDTSIVKLEVAPR